MPVLMIAEQPSLDEGTYASMLEQLMPLLRRRTDSCPTPEVRVPRRDAHIELGVRGGQPEVFNENLKPNLRLSCTDSRTTSFIRIHSMACASGIATPAAPKIHRSIWDPVGV